MGVLFLGWPAQTLIVLYFFDTIGAMMSIFAALMFSWLDKPDSPFFDRLYNLASSLALAALLAGGDPWPACVGASVLSEEPERPNSPVGL